MMWSTNLTGANLIRANFQKAKIIGANFQNANLHLADFAGALIREVNFSRTKLRRTNFQQTEELSQCIWTDAQIDETTKLSTKTKLEIQHSLLIQDPPTSTESS